MAVLTSDDSDDDADDDMYFSRDQRRRERRRRAQRRQEQERSIHAATLVNYNNDRRRGIIVCRCSDGAPPRRTGFCNVVTIDSVPHGTAAYSATFDLNCSMLAPSELGPIHHDQRCLDWGQNLQNVCLYSTVFSSEHNDVTDTPTDAFYRRRRAGYANTVAQRDKRALDGTRVAGVPLYVLWQQHSDENASAVVEVRLSLTDAQTLFCHIYTKILLGDGVSFRGPCVEYMMLLHMLDVGLNLQLTTTCAPELADTTICTGSVPGPSDDAADAEALNTIYEGEFDITRVVDYTHVLYTLLRFPTAPEYWPWKRCTFGGGDINSFIGDQWQ